MTNVMGTTDGHMQFSSTLYAQGTFPPILEQESVTRVGKHAHTMIQKQLATSITTLLADAKEQERFTQFGSELSEASRTILAMGSIMRLLMNQEEDNRLPADVQSVLLALVFTSFSTGKDAPFFSKFRHNIIEHITSDACVATRGMVTTEKDLGTFLSAVEHDVVPHLTATCHE
jgi:F-type H+/Na+-transporting ATPase subunit alpha